MIEQALDIAAFEQSREGLGGKGLAGGGRFTDPLVLCGPSFGSIYGCLGPLCGPWAWAGEADLRTLGAGADRGLGSGRPFHGPLLLVRTVAVPEGGQFTDPLVLCGPWPGRFTDPWCCADRRSKPVRTEPKTFDFHAPHRTAIFREEALNARFDFWVNAHTLPTITSTGKPRIQPQQGEAQQPRVGACVRSLVGFYIPSSATGAAPLHTTIRYDGGDHASTSTNSGPPPPPGAAASAARARARARAWHGRLCLLLRIPPTITTGGSPSRRSSTPPTAAGAAAGDGHHGGGERGGAALAGRRPHGYRRGAGGGPGHGGGHGQPLRARRRRCRGPKRQRQRERGEPGGLGGGVPAARAGAAAGVGGPRGGAGGGAASGGGCVRGCGRGVGWFVGGVVDF